MEICPVCHKERIPGNAYCDNCGYHFEEKRCPKCNNIINNNAVFCSNCGYKIEEAAPLNETIVMSDLPGEPEMSPAYAQGEKAAEPVQPVETAVPSEQVSQIPMPINPQSRQNTDEKEHKKSNKVLAIGIAAAVVMLLAIAAVVSRPLWNNQAKQDRETTAVSKAVKKEAVPPVYSYEVPKVIRPALYQNTDYVVYFKGSSEVEKEFLLTVEIPGFTQKYEQKIILKPRELKLKIRPPMVQGVLKTLNTSKESQIVVTLQDPDTNKFLIQDSRPVSILSKYDMKWVSDDGSETYYEYIAAWVTPESPKIKELLRNSINQLSSWTNGALNEVVGYQQIGGLQTYDVTYFQVAAIYQTMRNHYKVRYNATPVSTSGNEAQQRIALPEDVLNQKSGLCIETAVTMASAIEATGMHAMVLILPSHAQVAVETWANSGEYYLIETTALTEPDWNNIIYYLDKDLWSDYLAQNHITVIDLELARKDGIKPME